MPGCLNMGLWDTAEGNREVPRGHEGKGGPGGTPRAPRCPALSRLRAPPGDALPLPARAAHHSGALCDLPLGHPTALHVLSAAAAPSPQCPAGRRRDRAGAGRRRGAPERSPRLSLTPPAVSQRRGVSLKLPPFPPLPLSSVPQDGGETPQPPQGGLGGGRGSAGEQLSTGALRVVHGPAAAAW